MSPAELILARFALGLPNARAVGRRRACYCLCGDDDEKIWRALARRGLAHLVTSRSGVWVYSLTFEGALAALEDGESLEGVAAAGPAAAIAEPTLCAGVAA